MIMLFLVSFATTLGMSTVNTIWPLYIISLGATVLEASYVISLSGIVGTILTGLSGVISDRLGRKRVISLGLILATISPISYIFTRSWQELILWGSIYASVFSLFMPARNAWIADLVEPENRAAAYSFLFLALPVAGVVGPVLGGLIVDNFGWVPMFLFVAAVHGLSILPLVAIRAGDRSPSRSEPSLTPSPTEGGNIRILSLMILLWFIFGFGLGMINPMVPLYLTEVFKATKTEIGVFTSLGFGIAGSLSQIFSAKIAERLGNRRFLLYCSLVVPLALILWPSRTTYLELVILNMIRMAAWTSSWSPALSILMEAAPGGRRGLFSGLFEASVRLGMTLGPTFAGILWNNWGPRVPFYTASLILVFTVPTVLLVRRSGSARKYEEDTSQSSSDRIVRIESRSLNGILRDNRLLIDRCRDLLQTKKELESKISSLENEIRIRQTQKE